MGPTSDMIDEARQKQQRHKAASVGRLFQRTWDVGVPRDGILHWIRVHARTKSEARAMAKRQEPFGILPPGTEVHWVLKGDEVCPTCFRPASPG
jgi:hypothetical protein